jgi:hypothetical protein
MANVLKMAMSQSIQQLHAAGWSQRRIARELELDRGTVARHLRPPSPAANAAIPPTGSEGSNAATLALLPAPAPLLTPGNEDADGAGGSKAAILPTGSERENVAVPRHRRWAGPVNASPIGSSSKTGSTSASARSGSGRICARSTASPAATTA